MRCLQAAVAGLMLPVVMLSAGCSTNPATGKQQLNIYSEQQEIALGKQYHEQVVQQIGLYDDRELQQYVQRLGGAIAARSERPHLPWNFAVVDDAAVNAFALPGGQIYITRGMLGHLTSEAELVGILGHEAGHVTARHSVNQMSKAQLTQLGLTLGMVLSPEARQYGDLANLAGGLMFLKFSRDDERQADDLGLRYMQASGYPPQAMGEVFGLLSRVSAKEQQGRLPNWLATHPNPEERQQRIATQYTTGAPDPSSHLVATASSPRSTAWSTAPTRARASSARGSTITPSSVSPCVHRRGGKGSTSGRRSSGRPRGRTPSSR
jgi:predicted Zn-dependent protease